MLVNTRDQEGETLSDKEIRDEILTLLISGHETVAAAMSWAMYYLHENPEVKTKLIAEIESLGEKIQINVHIQTALLTAVCDGNPQIETFFDSGIYSHAERKIFYSAISNLNLGPI